MLSVKELLETGGLTAIPSQYVMPSNPSEIILSEAQSEIIPTIDFSLLTSGTPHQRSKVIQEIGDACREWGCFMVINHCISEKLMNDIIKAGQSYFELPDEEKKKYITNHFFDPIKYGTSFNNNELDRATFWRDYLKIHVHPHFNAPPKPENFREISQEYTRKSRELASELLKAISVSLGLEEEYIHKAMEFDLGWQLLAFNFYPPCPQPEAAIGITPHTDHGLLTLLTQNDLAGLQVLNRGKWIPIRPFSANSIFVNCGDHMQILTNDMYKSVVHRAMVNNKALRISVPTACGPSLNTIVTPAPALVDETHPLAYRGITYMEYMVLQQQGGAQRNGKHCLETIRA